MLLTIANGIDDWMQTLRFRSFFWMTRQPFGKWFKFYQESAGWPRQKLEKYQLDRLKAILEHCYENVPFYRRKFQESNFNPLSFRSLEDLHKIPPLTKSEVKEHRGEMIARGYEKSVSSHYTSGSTGIPLKFHADRTAGAHFNALQYRCRTWHGLGVGDRMIRVWQVSVDEKTRKGAAVKDFFKGYIRLPIHQLNQEEIIRASYQKGIQAGVRGIYGWSSAIFQFGQALEKLALDPRKLPLKRIICCGEMLLENQRSYLEDLFGCKVIQEYGSVEAGLLAHDCPSGNMHVAMEAACLEVLTETGPATSGRGEILVTGLYNRAMPLIRYRLGDVVELSSRSDCPCGLRLPLLAAVRGRTLDYVRTHSGEKISCFVFWDMLTTVSSNRGMQAILQAKFIQKPDGSIQTQIVPGPQYSATVETELIGKIKMRLGNKIPVQVEKLDQIPRDPSGKVRFFRSELSEL